MRLGDKAGLKVKTHCKNNRYLYGFLLVAQLQTVKLRQR
jgi:hypothetical protein